jgi:LysM repeat protein
MDMLRRLGGSLLLAAFSAALVIGGISLALAESYVPVVPTPTETQALIPIIPSPTSPPLAFITGTAIPAATNTLQPPTSSACPPPLGWIAVSVQPGDSLATLASRYQVTPQELSQANCLFSTDLPTGSILYVPSIPTNTPVPCGPPSGWIRYTVQPGNTMYSLSQAYGVSISQLQFANCMASNQFGLSTGQSLWVPNVATRTPRASATPTLTPVSIIFPTLTRTATITPTATASPTSTNVPTVTATGTATATASSTAPPPSPTATATATVTAFPSATETP